MGVFKYRIKGINKDGEINRVLLLNKFYFHLTTGIKSLFTTNGKSYTELFLGFDNIRFGK
ncbi:hypothetical protein B9C57_12320 [Tenacibaculum maritimum]|nr:hypothetical protein B9C57_12320 [Tenacibaculum maritimum]